LFLILSATSNAQIQSSYPPLNFCDNNNDGTGIFDLTVMIPEILSGMNPATTVVTFHETFTDAQVGANAIVNPNNFANINPFVQTVYIRVVNTLTSEVFFSTIDVRVLPTPTANPATLSFCDPNELPVYDLNTAIPQITTDPNAVVTFYYTQADANAATAPITGMPLVQTGIQTLYARVENPSTGCFTTTTLTLNTNTCDTTCHVPGTITISNVTDTTFYVNWTGLGIFTRIVVLPFGEPLSSSSPYIDILNQQTSAMITGLSPNGCYSVYLKKYCDVSHSSEWSAPVTICMANCANSGSCSEALILNAFIDANNNGVKDSGEVNFNYGNFTYQINDSGTDLYGTTNQGSYYIFDANPANSYDINFAVNPELSGYYASATTYSNVTLPDGSGANYLYFPITVIQPYTDARVFLYNQNNPRPGFLYNMTITYANYGLDPIAAGTLTFTKDPNLTISSVSQTGIVSTATGFTYDFTNLAPNEFRHIQISLLVPTIPAVTIGQLVTNSVTIQTVNDVNGSNNSATYSQAIVGSYDPNDKSESHGGKIVHQDFTANDYLYYTIRFENTGNASTEFIRVEDLLDSQLDENSFEMIAASHPVNTRRDGNQLTWHFYDTQLPPTSIDAENSHGFVYFRIKPKPGYAIGDIIPNTADIYFDYNPPIVTNTFNTEFVQSLSNPTFTNSSIGLYPNPAHGNVQITTSVNETIAAIVFYDISGKAVTRISNLSITQTTVDISALAKGVYFVEITTGTNLKQVKKLIVQ